MKLEINIESVINAMSRLRLVIPARSVGLSDRGLAGAVERIALADSADGLSRVGQLLHNLVAQRGQTDDQSNHQDGGDQD